ncbi:ParB N-terminal domain-containing protein [Telluribacter humicola]|uniref:hypothetical protein n=1 Tax=Telluribacter humicola TaxID=1720261 RepID=UPI001A96E3C6|nr:hypothetical protein [Telluribacter humicola]
MAKTKTTDKEKLGEPASPEVDSSQYVKSNLVILPELRDLIPPLRPEETQQLESNLLADGIKDPLTVWETTSDVIGTTSAAGNLPDQEGGKGPVYVLIDGHNRYTLARQHGLDYPVHILHFDDISQVRDYMINYQLGRRNLTPEQASYLRGLRYNKMKEENRSERINVAEHLAGEYKVSTRTIKRDAEYAKGLDELSPGLKSEVLGGKTKFPRAAAKALAKEKPDKPIQNAEELNRLLERLPKAFTSLDDLKETPEAQEDEKSREITNLIQRLVGEETEAVGGRKQTKRQAPKAVGLRQELKQLVEGDLSSKEVIQLIIHKAQALLNTLE